LGAHTRGPAAKRAQIPNRNFHRAKGDDAQIALPPHEMLHPAKIRLRERLSSETPTAANAHAARKHAENVATPTRTTLPTVSPKRCA